MFVLFLQNFQRRSIYFYAGIISVICAFSFMLGSWAGPSAWSVLSFEPQSCSVVLRNASRQQEDANATCAGEGVKGAPVDSVSFSFQFSTAMGRAAHWIHALKATLLFKGKAHLEEDAQLRFEAELLYLDDKSSEKKWLPSASAVETRKIYCSSSRVFKGTYGCTNLPIFQLLSVSHDAYRLDVRFVADCSGKIAYISDMSRLKDLRLVLRHERVPFSQAKAYLKAFFCPLTLFAHLWFHEAHRPFRSPIEKVLYAHSAALAALNIPFEYFLMWIQCPMWTLFLQVTEMAFQTTLFLAWIVFYKFLLGGGQTSADVSSCRPYLFLLMCWYTLGALDGFERSAAQQDPFDSPWGNPVTVIREVVSYELVCSTATLFVGFLVVYQLFQMYTKISMEKSILVDLKAKKCLGYYKNSAFAPFSVCLFSCVAVAILQYSLNLLLSAQWKMRMWEWDGSCLAPLLLSPGVATFFFGVANVFSVSLLLLMPSNVHMEKGLNRWHPALPCCKEAEAGADSLHCLLNCQVEKPRSKETVTKVEKELLNMLQLWVALEEDLAKEEEKLINANKRIV